MSGWKWQKLSTLSAYSRADSRLCQQTTHGAIVTLAGVALALLLLVNEIRHCMSVQYVQELGVDTSRSEILQLTFNLTFPALPCETLAMDVQDASGKFHTDASIKRAHQGEVHKYQLSAEGRRMHLKEYITPKGLGENPFVVVLDEDDMNNMKGALKRHEGCNVFGWLSVPRVSGSLHFSVRSEAMLLAMNMQDIIQALMMRHTSLHGELHPDAHQLNVSHAIHSFHFGPRYPRQVNALEGVRRIDRKANGVDKYFIKVVPTDFHGLYGRRLHTNQYSMTEYYHRLQEEDNQPPAVFFLYDMSPIRMKIEEYRPGVLRLLVRLCAVVGGTFAVTKLVDRIVHAAVISMSHKGGIRGPSTKQF